MKKYLVIIPVLLLVYIISFNYKSDNINSKEEYVAKTEEDLKDKEVKEKLVSVSYNNQKLSVSIDEYIVGVLSCEMPALFNEEALKAGAVAARTFYMYKENINSEYVATNNDQCFIDKEKMLEKWGENYDKYYSNIEQAVKSTSGEFITYNGEVIQSFYFSMSNGYTEASESVFSEARPYLVSVESLWDKNLSTYEKEIVLSKNDFLNKLGLEEESLDIKVISRSNSGRVNMISINGNEFKGTEFRQKLGLRSTDFDIKVEENSVLITTRGYGHGVGLSQYGANEMAKLGYNYKDIIKHYYKGVEISTI